MEKIRVALAWIARHHFWLLSGLVALVALGSWYTAASALDEAKKTNIGQIDSAFGNQDRLRGRTFIPNVNVNEQQQKEIDQLVDDVKDLWQKLYDRQREEVLKWPAQLPSRFRREVSTLQFGDSISKLLREQYTDYIEGRFNDLPKIIDANELDESLTGRGGGERGFGREEGGRESFGGHRGRSDDSELLEVDYTVNWADGDQGRIKQDLTWPTTVSHWRIWVTQEDLWVYETLLRAIADTNKAKGADRRSNAAITDVYELQVGKLAAKESRTKGRIHRSQAASSPGSEFDREGGRGESESEPGGGREEEFGRGGERGGSASSAEEKAMFLSRRYIDEEGKPISVPPDDEPLEPAQFGREIKRLPVRLWVRMDTRWLHVLTAELANADLQIKVTEIRINPSESGGPGGRGGRGGEGIGRGGGREFGGHGFGFGGGGRGGNQSILTFERRPYMQPVIIQGVVLIFNQPAADLLDSGAGGDDFM